MEEITIGGFTIEQLKKMQAAVRKDAHEVISNAISVAMAAMDCALELGETKAELEEALDPELEGYAGTQVNLVSVTEEIQKLAKLAKENLGLADLVAGVSGVKYYLPYSSEYDNDGYCYKFECSDLYDYINKDNVSELVGVLEDMEYQSRQWNQSTC
ncbi:MAG: hypothetical protein ACXW1D_00200 [Halobacteriota archaeon]